MPLFFIFLFVHFYLLQLIRDVAAGMLQLENKGIFHLDLRAQNVLISHKVDRYVAKLNDFGLSKDTFNLNEFKNVSFPIRWTDVQILNGMFFIFLFIIFLKLIVVSVINYFFLLSIFRKSSHS